MTDTTSKLILAFLEDHPEANPGDVDELCTLHPESASELRAVLTAHRIVDSAIPPLDLDPGSALLRPSRWAASKVAPLARAHRQQDIGDFHLLRLIGRGGMGEVWEAEQVSLRRRVALKLILPERVSDESLALFAREARAAGRLSHPDIVALHGNGEADGFHWIAMELVDNACTLKDSIDVLRQAEQLPRDYFEQVATSIERVAQALAYAHSAGIIHRDIKPQNILITAAGAPKLVDFGLARIVEETVLSQTGDVRGTYAYMSPEQVEARRGTIDERTDIFSLGVVLYEMLALQRPFVGDTTHQIAHQILVVDPTPPDEIRSKAPGDLAVICGKAMEKDPERRYGSMAELAADLSRHLASKPILAKPPTTLQRTTKWVKRNPTKSVAAGVAAGAMVVISWLGLVAVDNAKQAETNAQLAEEQRAEAEQRAVELEQVARFQEEQLSGIEVPSMGMGIHRRLLEGARATWERVTLEEEVLGRRALELEELVAVTDFTGIALNSLDEHVFAGALEALADFDGPPLVRAHLLQTVANTLRELGLMKRAEAPQEEALEIRRKELGNEDPKTLSSIYNSGILLTHLNRTEEAEQLHREALEVRRLQSDEVAQVASLNGLTSFLLKHGRFEEAEELLLEALEICRRTPQDHAVGLRVSTGSMGSALAELLRIEEAEVYMRKAVELARSSPKRDTNEYLQEAINNLAWFLNFRARTENSRSLNEEAVELFEEVLAISRHDRGNQHYLTLRFMRNLGVTYLTIDNLEKAEPLLQEGLKLSRRTLGSGHSDTLSFLGNMGDLREAQGRLDEAETYLREAVEIGQRTCAPDDQNLPYLMNSLAKVLLTRDKLDEAVHIYEEALSAFKRALHPGHPHITSAQDMLDYAIEMKARSELESANKLEAGDER